MLLPDPAEIKQRVVLLEDDRRSVQKLCNLIRLTAMLGNACEAVQAASGLYGTPLAFRPVQTVLIVALRLFGESEVEGEGPTDTIERRV